MIDLALVASEPKEGPISAPRLQPFETMAAAVWGASATNRSITSANQPIRGEMIFSRFPPDVRNGLIVVRYCCQHFFISSHFLRLVLGAPLLGTLGNSTREVVIFHPHHGSQRCSLLVIVRVGGCPFVGRKVATRLEGTVSVAVWAAAAVCRWIAGSTG